MAVSSRTYLQLIQEVAERLGALDQGTLTAATTSLLTINNYPFKTGRTAASDKKYEGCEIYSTQSGTAASPNPNGIASYDASGGTFVPSFTYTTQPGATDTVDIHKKGITRDMLKKAINRALRNLYYRTLAPLSLLADADMELSATTSWGTVSNATFTKNTTAGDLIYGERVGNVANSAVNGYLPSASIDVDPEATYFIQADLRVTSGTANLIAYDETNSANIDYEEYDEYDWTRLAFTFTIPATCKQITIRLAGEEAAADVDWDNVILLKSGAKQVPLPDYITEIGQLRRVLTCTGQDYAEQDDLYEYFWWNVKADMMGPNQRFFLALDPGISNGPIYLDVLRPYAELTADTDTTVCDRELLVLQAKYELLRDLIQGAPGRDISSWKQELAATRRELKAEGHKQLLAPYFKMGFSTPPITP